VPQVLQLPLAQPAQELPPTGIEDPPSLTEKQAKVEGTRSALFLQVGHEAEAPERLNGRISSNLESHLRHSYS
jgi:hypothetical protein